LLQVYDRDVSVRDLLISEMSRMLMFPGTPDALSPEAMALIEAANEYKDSVDALMEVCHIGHRNFDEYQFQIAVQMEENMGNRVIVDPAIDPSTGVVDHERVYVDADFATREHQLFPKADMRDGAMHYDIFVQDAEHCARFLADQVGGTLIPLPGGPNSPEWLVAVVDKNGNKWMAMTRSTRQIINFD
ncbi:MAG: hypothetical protein U9Q67_00810, partial [Patescibacteria group bacterium]|nr:hypothetical protein [Patescibacteria group bacterium]